MGKKILLSKVAVIFALGLFGTLAIAGSFTLSDEDLMLLDYNNAGYSTAKVTQITDVEGPGVEFDIHFPSMKRINLHTQYVSCKKGGKGTLTGIDISKYDGFELKFTLLSVNGSDLPGASGEFVVGALVNRRNAYAYRPELVSLEPDRNTTISLTLIDTNDISIIGFAAGIANDTKGWDPNGSTVKLLIEAAPDTEILP